MSTVGKFLMPIRRGLMTKFRGVKYFGSVSNDADGNILKSEFPDIDIPSVTIPEMLHSRIGKFSKHTATECSVTGRSYTYDQIRLKARNLGKNLRKKLKLEQGDVVGIFLPNVPEFPICCLGILEAGLVVTTLNPLYKPEEISKQLTDCSAKAIITLYELHDTVEKSTQLLKQRLPIITIKSYQNQSVPRGSIDFDEFTNAKVDLPDFQPGNPNDLAFLPYSSGTTGLPKGVRLSHANLVANVTQLMQPDVHLLMEASENHQDVQPAVLPMFHIYGITTLLLHSQMLGCKLVTLPKFTPELYISVLEKHEITSICAAPPLVMFFSLHPGVKVEHFKKVRNVMSGAAPLGPSDEQRFSEKFGKNIVLQQGYGLTETSPVVSLLYSSLKSVPGNSGSIGRPLCNTLCKIVAVDDPTGTPLGPNERGELLVKGPQVMKSYHERPEETEKSFLDGWFRTGDLMYYNEHGLLFVTDRLKELIKVKGFQVAPAELEEVIRSFPSVSDAAVIGIPHPVYGEVPRAYVAVKPNAKFHADDLDEFVKAKVAPYKQLKGGVEVVDAIPKNAAGKILRRQLKLKYDAKNK